MRFNNIIFSICTLTIIFFGCENQENVVSNDFHQKKIDSLVSYYDLRTDSLNSLLEKERLISNNRTMQLRILKKEHEELKANCK